jgi:hypothetical protein
MTTAPTAPTAPTARVSRGAGALLQMIVWGAGNWAPENWLHAHGMEATHAHPSNTRDSIMHWFVGRKHGFARSGDISAEHNDGEDDEDMAGIFSHAPQHQQPSKDVTQPIYVRSGAPLQAEDALAALVAQRALQLVFASGENWRRELVHEQVREAVAEVEL